IATGILCAVHILVAVTAVVAVVLVIIFAARIGIVGLVLGDVLTRHRRSVLEPKAVTYVAVSPRSCRTAVNRRSHYRGAVTPAGIAIIVGITVASIPTILAKRRFVTRAIAFAIAFSELAIGAHPSLIAAACLVPVTAAVIAGIVLSRLFPPMPQAVVV